ncbi:MAG: ABC transporter ATP-binding protein [Actinomycetes bacterium]
MTDLLPPPRPPQGADGANGTVPTNGTAPTNGTVAPPYHPPHDDAGPTSDAATTTRSRELFPYLGDRGWRPLLALALLSASTLSPFVVFLTQRASLSIDLGITTTQLTRASGLVLAALVFGAFVAALAARAVDAALLLRACAVIVGITSLVGTGVADPTALAVIIFVVALFTGPVVALCRAYAFDVFGPGAGWRVAACCWSGTAAGVALLASWQVVDPTPDWGLQLGLTGLLAVAGAVLLPRPRPEAATHDGDPEQVAGPYPPVAPFLALGLGVGLAVVGTAPVALDLLATRWEAGPKMVGVGLAVAALVTAVVCACAHWYSSVARRDAAALSGLAGAALLTAALLMALGAASQTLIGVLGSWGAAGVCTGFAACAVDAALLGTGGPSRRHYQAGALLVGVAVGGLAVVVMPTVADGLGEAATIALAAAPLALFGVLAMVRWPAATHHDDAPAPTDVPVRNGLGPAPLLECRGIRAGYDGVQVLFDVDLTVEEGSIVALMGTNGAGKTTLLRTISGLLTPASGTIRFGGVALDDFGPTERVQLGMAQIAGGESLAPGLTVAENLTMFAYTLHGRGAAARVSSAVDQAFAQFPRLAERRGQQASTLSGGEKQMLALAKAFVLQPRLLVIDEFSLGLAPRIVGELLPVVQQINAAGTSVLLVEQSVNVALSVAHRACFMEKGEIVFDGSADSLRAQPDLLRAVYLEGITAAIGAV